MSDQDKQLAEVAGYADKIKAQTAEQGSIEWLMERLGHCTASRFKDVLNFQKSGKEGTKRAAYRMELVVERLTGKPAEHFVSNAMQDGLDREPIAKMAYEARTGLMLHETGFTHHPSIQWVGGSPDALIGSDGGAEFKCPTPGTHVDTLLNGMSNDHLPQIQGLIWIFGRQWWDFASYQPIFPEALQLYIQRVPANHVYIADLEIAVLKLLDEIDAQHKKLRELAEAHAMINSTLAKRKDAA